MNSELTFNPVVAEENFRQSRLITTDIVKRKSNGKLEKFRLIIKNWKNPNINKDLKPFIKRATFYKYKKAIKDFILGIKNTELDNGTLLLLKQYEEFLKREDINLENSISAEELKVTKKNSNKKKDKKILPKANLTLNKYFAIIDNKYNIIIQSNDVVYLRGYLDCINKLKGNNYSLVKITFELV